MRSTHRLTCHSGRSVRMRFSTWKVFAPDAEVRVVHNGNSVRVNGQAVKMFGYPREEQLGQQIEILLPLRLRGVHQVQRAGFMARARIRPMGLAKELWGLRRVGSEFSVEICLSPIPSTEGIRVVSIIRDVTDRERMAQQLREADRRKDEFFGDARP